VGGGGLDKKLVPLKKLTKRKVSLKQLKHGIKQTS